MNNRAQYRSSSECDYRLRHVSMSITLLALLLVTVLPTIGQTRGKPITTPASGTWIQTANLPPDGIDTMLLQTDGTVICHTGNTQSWYRLTPDTFGSYVNGTWSTIAMLPAGYGPLYYASAVLADGRTIVIGGEYNFGGSDTRLGAIYDPLAGTWTSLAPPNWSGQQVVADAQCAVLPNGKFVLADILSSEIATLDPTTLTWTSNGAAAKADGNDEEGWTLLPNGTLLTVDATSSMNSGRNSEIYDPVANTWTTAGDTIGALVDSATEEIGPAILRPDGTVFCPGANRHNGQGAVYDTNTGTWSHTTGMNFPSSPSQLDEADGPAALLPNGNVLCVGSPGVFFDGLHVFEWNGTNLTEVANVPGASSISTYFTRMLPLPTGQVMFTSESDDVEIYTPSGGPNSAWRPTISTAPPNLIAGSLNNPISGTQFNGLSQASAYGDDATNATNYPLVRLTNHANAHVIYCRTHNHSTMGVATGATVVSTQFDVPAAAPAGTYDLEVVANGIGSVVRTATVAVGNDNFASAQVITGTSGKVSTGNFGATAETGEPNHAGASGGHSIWYRWTPPRNGVVAFSTAYSSFDTVLAVYTGAAANTLSLVASNDDINAGKTSWLSFNAVVGTTYQIAVDGHGPAVGSVVLTWTQGGSDFDADGLSDLVLQNPTSLQVSIGHVNGSALTSYKVLNALPSGWQVAAVGDFNADGMPDLVLQNPTSRQVSIGFVTGSTVGSFHYLATLPSGWQVAGAGDFNGDGQPDLVLENPTSHQVSIGSVSALVLTGYQVLKTLPPGWHVVGTGDFNGDGQADIVLQNPTTNQVSIGYVSGSTISSYQVLKTLPSGWRLVGAGDLNSDGQPDLVLQNASTRQVSIGYVTGAVLTSYQVLTTLPSGWQVVGPR